MVIWGVDFFTRRRDGELGRLREAMNEARELKLEREREGKGLLSSPLNQPWTYTAPESDPA